jgi:hypothetical protein
VPKRATSVTPSQSGNFSPFSLLAFPLMPDYPKPCPKCGVLTERDGFAADRHAPSGRKSHCRECDRKKAAAYYAAHRDELYAQREAAREAAREAEFEALAREHKKRVEAAHKLAAAGARRQKEFLRSIGVPDLSPEEVAERARRHREAISLVAPSRRKVGEKRAATRGPFSPIRRKRNH